MATRKPALCDDVFFLFEEINGVVIALNIYAPVLLVAEDEVTFGVVEGVSKPGMTIGHLDGCYPPVTQPIDAFTWNPNQQRWEA